MSFGTRGITALVMLHNITPGAHYSSNISTHIILIHIILDSQHVCHLQNSSVPSALGRLQTMSQDTCSRSLLPYRYVVLVSESLEVCLNGSQVTFEPRDQSQTRMPQVIMCSKFGDLR